MARGEQQEDSFLTVFLIFWCFFSRSFGTFFLAAFHLSFGLECSVTIKGIWRVVFCSFRDPTRRSRIAEQRMPIEMRPHRNPRKSRSMSPKRSGLPGKPIKLSDPLKTPHRPFREVAHDAHAAKLFSDGIHGRMNRRRTPPPKRRSTSPPPKRRSTSRSPSLAIRRAVTAKSGRPKKTAGNDARISSQAPKCTSRDRFIAKFRLKV